MAKTMMNMMRMNMKTMRGRRRKSRKKKLMMKITTLKQNNHFFTSVSICSYIC